MKKIFPMVVAFMPMAALAAGTITDALNTVKDILNAVIPLLMIIATVVFLWGIIRYITSAGDSDKSAEGKSLMIWGIIGLFVMVGMWGLVQVLISTFGIQTGTAGIVPPKGF